MTDLSALIEKLSAAAEGSRALDGEIAAILGLVEQVTVSGMQDIVFRAFGEPEARRTDPPSFSRSLDAALTLFPEGFAYVLRSPRTNSERYAVDLIKTGVRTEYGTGFSFVGEPIPAATPALALCIAALKAREASHV